MHPRRTFALLSLVACLQFAAPAQTPPSYSLTFLGPAASVNALSETGVIVGQVSVGGATRGWVSQGGGAPVLLPLAAGDQSSWALDVDEQGFVVGAASSFTSPEFFGRAVAWQPSPGGYVLQNLGMLPGHSASVATAVNNVGDIVGYSSNGTFRYPVLFTAPSGPMDLSAFGVFDPQSINDARVFVDRQARRMDLGTMTVQNLGLPPGPPSYSATTGYAINEHGQIAGTAVLATSTSCVYQAARYVDGPGWQILTPCSGVANAYDINDLGDVLYKAFLSLDSLVHLEGIGDFNVQQLLDPGTAPWTVLGFGMDIDSARNIAVIAHHPGTGQTGVALLTPIQTCQPSLGFGGPGSSQLMVCGGSLASGTVADVTLSGVPAFGQALLVASLVNTPTPLVGGTLVPVPVMLVLPLVAGPAGTAVLGGIPGGIGPLSLYAQCVHADALLPGGWGFSNAVRIDFLP